MSYYFLISSFLLTVSISTVIGRFTEQERIANWHKHFTWPPNWNVESDGYRALMEQREREIMAIPASDERWYVLAVCKGCLDR